MNGGSAGAGAQPQGGAERRGRSATRPSTSTPLAATSGHGRAAAGPPPISPLPAPQGARGLVVEALTGQAPESLSISEIDPQLAPWREGLARRHRALAAMAERARKPTLAAWHTGRANSLARLYSERVDECGTGERGSLRVWCRDCGEVHDHPIACNVRALCGSCSRRKAQKRQRRVTIGLQRAEREARAKWNREGRRKGREPRPALLTFTVRHEQPETDRDVIAKAWPNFRRALQHELGTSAPPYVAGWEMTPGTRADGHVHLHAAVILPWVEREALKAHWSRLTRGRGSLDMATNGSKAQTGETIQTSAHAAAYVSKYGRGGLDLPARNAATVAQYAAKGAGAHVGTLRADLAAAWVRIAHARRMSTTSRRLLSDIPDSQPCQCHGPQGWGVNYERPGEQLRCSVVPRGPPVEA